MNWIAFGQLGHWSEWAYEADTLRELLHAISSYVAVHKEGFVMEVKSSRQWRVTDKPFKMRRVFPIGFRP